MSTKKALATGRIADVWRRRGKVPERRRRRRRRRRRSKKTQVRPQGKQVARREQESSRGSNQRQLVGWVGARGSAERRG